MLRRILTFIPLIVFGLLAAIFLMKLITGGDNSVVPSALIGQQVPQISLPALDTLEVPSISPDIFIGKVTLVNIWASWCGPCRLEHPILMELAKDQRLQIIGINYKDRAKNALRFLAELGNPYDFVGVDTDGRSAIEWGVYGVPETFIVDENGIIVYKHIGPLTDAVMRQSVFADRLNLLLKQQP